METATMGIGTDEFVGIDDVKGELGWTEAEVWELLRRQRVPMLGRRRKSARFRRSEWAAALERDARPLEPRKGYERPAPPPRPEKPGKGAATAAPPKRRAGDLLRGR